MARTPNMELRTKKANVINEIVSFAKAVAKNGNPVKVTRFYEEIPEAQELWRTRAYFIQELKKMLPSDVEVISRQRKGTFIKLKSPERKLVISNPIKGEKVLVGTVVNSIPDGAKRVSESKWPKALKMKGNIEEAFRIPGGYIVRENGELVQYK